MFWIYLIILIGLFIIAYTKWNTLTWLEKALMTLLEILFTSFSLQDIKNQFKTYEEYKREQEEKSIKTKDK